MTAPTELDIRIAALCTEYELSIAAQARRSASLAAELAAQAHVKVLEDAAKTPTSTDKPPAGP